MKTFGAMCTPDLRLTLECYEMMLSAVINDHIYVIALGNNKPPTMERHITIATFRENKASLIKRLKELIACIQLELALHS
jgi:deoxycytidylate deaminase